MRLSSETATPPHFDLQLKWVGRLMPYLVPLHVNLDKTADFTKETSSVQAASVTRC